MRLDSTRYRAEPWKVATGLRLTRAENTFAPQLDILYDSPFEVRDFNNIV